MISLAFKAFNIHQNSSLSNLFTTHNFSDVRLVSDDQIPFKAHKYILGACSPTMKNLLLDYPHSNPLMYLRGVNQQDLESILQFINLGETKIQKSCIDSFLEIAKDFQLKELIKESTAVSSFLETEDETYGNKVEVNYLDCTDFQLKEPIQEVIAETTFLDIEDATHDKLDCKDEISISIKIPEIKKHFYSCDKCESVFQSKDGLRVHRKSKHEGVQYSCNKCELG